MTKIGAPPFEVSFIIWCFSSVALSTGMSSSEKEELRFVVIVIFFENLSYFRINNSRR